MAFGDKAGRKRNAVGSGGAGVVAARYVSLLALKRALVKGSCESVCAYCSMFPVGCRTTWLPKTRRLLTDEGPAMLRLGVRESRGSGFQNKQSILGNWQPHYLGRCVRYTA